MKEYEYLFATTLHMKLKDRIIGKIYVLVDQYDRLIVEIKRESEGIVFRDVMTDFAEKFYNGLCTDFVAYEITKKYREFLNQRYFYSNRREV